MMTAMTLENTVGSRRCSHRRDRLAATSMTMTAMPTTRIIDERNNNNDIRNNSSHDADDDDIDYGPRQSIGSR
jgi:hypothetical protein